MSKNTGASKFRKVNVDLYSEDTYQDDDGDADSLSQGPTESDVISLLNQNNNLEALKLVLNNPSVMTRDQLSKDRALQLVMKVLLSFRPSEIENTVQSLDLPSIDVLMKYVYRGFEIPSEGSSAQLLTWHEKAYSVSGAGSIIRVLTDRKRV